MREQKVRFLSLFSLQTRESDFLIASSALLTPTSLLNVADSDAIQSAMAFFFPLRHSPAL